MINRLSHDISAWLGRIATREGARRITLVFDSCDAAHNPTRSNTTPPRGDIDG